jgi:hypothetical protein
MRHLKYFALLAMLALPAVYSHAQVAIGVQIGPDYGLYNAPPVCAYGFYPYYPYECAPYGYWGPQWFVSGVFIGAGPWDHFYYRHPEFYRRYYGGGFDRFRGDRGFRGGYRDFRESDRGFRGGDHRFVDRERSFRGNGRGYAGGDRGYHGNEFHGHADHGSRGGGGGFHGGGRSGGDHGGGDHGGGGHGGRR